MAKIMIHLVFPQHLIKKPVIYVMAKRYTVIPNIRRAKVNDKTGEVTMELAGTKANLEKAKRHLEKRGIKVEPVLGDIVE